MHADLHHAPRSHSDELKLAFGALGVVYGDIGTSPLYAIKECFGAEHNVAPDVAGVLGILSLVSWSLILVVVIKYLSYVMRADNRGEGGILALLALVTPKNGGTRRVGTLILLGLFGSALLYGDGIITPAISVLSAVEGLEVATAGHEVATSALKPMVIPITVGILVALFLFQRRGTERVGAVFGPAMAVWFVTLISIGLPWIFRAPVVLQALNPLHAIRFFGTHGSTGFFVLGAVVLVITGGEALYADMGHFGKRPIRLAWYGLVFPALLINYYGQGALLLAHGPVANPFFALVSGWLRYPLVVIATVATVVASQALISGAYSLTQQAVQLGYWPRVTIKHTSERTEGQIYINEINAGLMVACVALVLTFRSSSNLAAAYGIAVTGTMSITSVLFYVVCRQRWGWSRLHAGTLAVLFLIIDLGFFSANAIKVAEGGWVPIAIAGGVFTVMTTWKRGRALLSQALFTSMMPIDAFLEDLKHSNPPRVPGTAVFMTSNADVAPPVLLHHFKHNKMLHKQVVCLSITTHHVPEVPASERIESLVDLGAGVYQVKAAYGFMQTPSMKDIFAACAESGLKLRIADTSFYLGRETLVIRSSRGMSRWRKRLFAFLARNAQPANAFFQIPPHRVVELGTQIEL